MNYKLIVSGEEIGEVVQRELVEAYKELKRMHTYVGETRVTELMTAVASGEVYRLERDGSPALLNSIGYVLELAGKVKTLRVMRGGTE